ncbi:hypothetical protein N7539_004512 [Penicillium diatomitis]|uniref:Uncharacterized protein n=1 Tax=Penicillium diatomitis TaxID=2819901 RepID=A0A9W9XF83_9EURO|nr:uncharacterized protein N7539_004512 [Penicillium diatomitis]KAJ5489622.1 hypothetical protein N7539_004512 [Penicillium diatomitis]
MGMSRHPTSAYPCSADCISILEMIRNNNMTIVTGQNSVGGTAAATAQLVLPFETWLAVNPKHLYNEIP